MPQRLRLIDAFVGPRARGNPAGVCLLARPAEESWMQSIAEEMNQAETAFAHPEADGVWRLRWFTPVAEVDLCGHATLATAHALFEDGQATDEARFQTRSGLLVCRRSGGQIAMDFPAQGCKEAPLPEPLIELSQSQWHGEAGADYMILLDSEEAVRDFVPDFAAIAKLEARGLLITAPGQDIDIVSRFFAPQYGIPEDPATGSAHCALAPFWAERLGKTKMTAFQASKRGGLIDLELHGDRVSLKGRANVVLDGTLL